MKRKLLASFSMVFLLYGCIGIVKESENEEARELVDVHGRFFKVVKTYSTTYYSRHTGNRKEIFATVSSVETGKEIKVFLYNIRASRDFAIVKSGTIVELDTYRKGNGFYYIK